MKEDADYLRYAAYLDEAGRNLGLILFEIDEYGDKQPREWRISDEIKYLEQVRIKIQQLIDDMLPIYQDFKAMSKKSSQ